MFWVGIWRERRKEGEGKTRDSSCTQKPKTIEVACVRYANQCVHTKTRETNLTWTQRVRERGRQDENQTNNIHTKHKQENNQY